MSDQAQWLLVFAEVVSKVSKNSLQIMIHPIGFPVFDVWNSAVTSNEETKETFDNIAAVQIPDQSQSPAWLSIAKSLLSRKDQKPGKSDTTGMSKIYLHPGENIH